MSHYNYVTSVDILIETTNDFTHTPTRKVEVIDINIENINVTYCALRNIRSLNTAL